MDIQKSKVELIKLILNTNDLSLIEKAYSIIKTESNEKATLTQDQIDEIELGLEQLENGQGTSFRDFLKKVS
ncbi:MAG: hypothetical protein ABR574_06680 [Cryomorphaceae bacterium]|nr:hypothetical protein [Flavobacteriales bacterium]